MKKMITVFSALASVALGSLSSDTLLPRGGNGNRVSVLHVSSDTDTGAIVKTFPHDLQDLSLLQSEDSDKFYLLHNGDLMLARSLDCEAGSNLSLALTHHILNQTVLHLLNVQVHGPGQFLEYDKPEYVMSLRENQPPGTKVGLVTLSGLSESQKFEFSLFPVRYWTKFSTKINYDISNTVSVTLITLKPLDQDKRISADPRWAKFDFVGIRVDVSAL